MINIDISIGDQILVGRFKNKKIEVKDIGVDKHGGPTINGRSILKIRKMKSPNERREAVHYILDAMEKNSLDEVKAEDVLKKYVKNPYGIGAERVNDEGKFYSLLFGDSHSRENAIKKLRIHGILAKKMRKIMQPKGAMFRYELVLHKESINEKTDRFNNVHAESKKELKAAMSKAMDQIAKGKNPKFDIINGRTGEMIGWIEGQDYRWQTTAIASALRELK